MRDGTGVIHLGALTGQTGAPPPRATVLPESRSAANQISETFAYQSYFDTTLLQTAILEQPLGQPIVQSTLKQQQLSGYAIGNHPDSETPVAVVFAGEGRQSGSAVHIIPPGAIVRPTSGSANGGDGFQSFTWGLPFGWLGGGTATIVVFQTPDAWANWIPRPQVLFHRFRAQILAPDGIPAVASIASWPRNWPTRFPSLVMQRGSSALAQAGAPQIAISQPGQTLLRYIGTVGSDTRLKAVFYHTTDFNDELAATAASPLLDTVEFAIPARTPYAYPAGYIETTVFEGPAELSRLGCNGKATNAATLIAGVEFVSDDPGIQGQYIDVCRYGYL